MVPQPTRPQRSPSRVPERMAAKTKKTNRSDHQAPEEPIVVSTSTRRPWCRSLHPGWRRPDASPSPSRATSRRHRRHQQWGLCRRRSRVPRQAHLRDNLSRRAVTRRKHTFARRAPSHGSDLEDQARGKCVRPPPGRLARRRRPVHHRWRRDRPRHIKDRRLDHAAGLAFIESTAWRLTTGSRCSSWSGNSACPKIRAK